MCHYCTSEMEGVCSIRKYVISKVKCIGAQVNTKRLDTIIAISKLRYEDLKVCLQALQGTPFYQLLREVQDLHHLPAAGDTTTTWSTLI